MTADSWVPWEAEELAEHHLREQKLEDEEVEGLQGLEEGPEEVAAERD